MLSCLESQGSLVSVVSKRVVRKLDCSLISENLLVNRLEDRYVCIVKILSLHSSHLTSCLLGLKRQSSLCSFVLIIGLIESYCSLLVVLELLFDTLAKAGDLAVLLCIRSLTLLLGHISDGRLIRLFGHGIHLINHNIPLSPFPGFIITVTIITERARFVNSFLEKNCFFLFFS